MKNENIIDQLLSGGDRTGILWREFLNQHSRLLLKIIWQFEHDYDEAMEKYVYVCRKLAENDFAILKRFRQQGGDNPPQFTTWLAAVTHNLCVDAHRISHGRRQLPRAILRLSEFDREVFRLYYWKGYSLDDIEQRFANTPGHISNTVAESLSHMRETLTGPSARRHTQPIAIPFDEQDVNLGSTEMDHDLVEMMELLDAWLDELNDQERMIIRLRFWEGMTGSEIAKAMKISPEQRVYPLLQNTLSRLRERALQTYTNKSTGDLSV